MADQAATIAGSSERLALALTDYTEAGVTDFLVLGLRTTQEIAAFGNAVVSLVRKGTRTRNGRQHEPRTSFANPFFARRSRYPA